MPRRSPTSLGTCFSLLSEDEGSALERIGKSQGLLADVEAWEPQAAAWVAELEELRIRLAELATTVGHRLDGLEADPARLDRGRGAAGPARAPVPQARRRHARGARPARRRSRPSWPSWKGTTPEPRRAGGEGGRRSGGVPARRRSRCRSKRERVGEGAGVRASRASWAISGSAAPASPWPWNGAGAADSPLLLDGAAVDFGRDGLDQVVFLFSPNPGEEPRPLARIASGGELSRIHLALQLASRARPRRRARAWSSTRWTPGIGGAEAAALGRKLQRLACAEGARGQILAVTHLPQVASLRRPPLQGQQARGRAGAPACAVEELEAEARVEEVARMLAGKQGDPAQPLARPRADRGRGAAPQGLTRPAAREAVSRHPRLQGGLEIPSFLAVKGGSQLRRDPHPHPPYALT